SIAACSLPTTQSTFSALPNSPCAENRTPQSKADHSLLILQNQFAVWKRRAPTAGPSGQPVPAIALHWDFVLTQPWPTWRVFWQRRWAISKSSAPSISMAVHRARFGFEKMMSAHFQSRRKRQCAILSGSSQDDESKKFEIP